MENMVELHKVTLAKAILQGTNEAKRKSGYYSTIHTTLPTRLQLAEASYLLNKMQLKATVLNKFMVSKETVVMRLWESET